MNKVLITGITGFIGSRLAKRLIDSGIQVFGITRPKSNCQNLIDLKDKITFHNYDGRINSLLALLKNERFDVIFHLAADSSYEHTIDNIDNILKSNIVFGTHLLDANVKTFNVPFINTSSYWTNIIKAYSPVNLYAATKKAFIDILIFYNQTYATKSVTLKLYDVYGENDKRMKILNFINRAAKSNEKAFFTRGEQEIDLVYVEDVVDAYIQASKMIRSCKKCAHKTFAIATKRKVTLKELVSLYEQVTGRHIDAHWGKYPYRPRQIFQIHYIDPILPKWKSKVTLEDGIRIIERKENV